MLGHVIELFRPASYLELGSGFGNWARVAELAGIREIVAVDGPWTELTRLVIDPSQFTILDLEKEIDLGRKFDLALSLEVAEHISPASADIFVRNLVKHSDLVMFGAAIPFQDGFGHVNEQWPSYWIEKFRGHGFGVYDILRHRFWSDGQIAYYYRQNSLIFINQSRLDLTSIASQELSRVTASSSLVDAVHPEKFLYVARYQNVSLRRLLPRLPSALLSAMKRAMRSGGDS
jgi:hypothetical protein